MDNDNNTPFLTDGQDETLEPVSLDDALLEIVTEAPRELSAPMAGLEVSARLTAALQYAERGLKVFPCRPGTKFPLFKQPFENASTNPDIIKGWFTVHGDCNIAFCPEDNGLLVIDTDNKNGKTGEANWQDLPGEKPWTRTIITPTDGLHRHYKGSCRATVGKINKEGKLVGLADGVDTRGIRSLALLPPSITKDGAYEWLDNMEPVSAPDWLVEWGKPRERKKTEAPAGFDLDLPLNIQRATDRLRERVKLGQVARVGDRDDTTFRVACEMLEYGVSPWKASELMHDIWAPACDDLNDGLPAGVDDLIDWKLESALKSMQNAIGSRAYPDFSQYLPDNLPAVEIPRVGATETAVRPKARPKVRLINGADRKAVKVEWLWPGYLAQGKFHILGGQKGAGKSTLTFDLFAAITTGGKWPDGTQAPLGDVLIWSAEDDFDDTILPRFLAAGGDPERLYFVEKVVENENVRHFDPATDMEELLEAARELPNLKAVMVDPVVSAVAGDSHKNAETRRGLQPLVDFAAERRVALLGITHFTKNTQGREPTERITGSLAFGALSRVVLGAVKGEHEDAPRRLVRIASNIGPAGDGFEYTLRQELLPDYDFTAQRVAWGQHLTGSAMELLNDAQAKPGKGLEAGEFLIRMLTEAGDEGMAVSELKEAAEAHGIAWRTIERAKTDLGGITSTQRSGASRGGWNWGLDPASRGRVIF